MKKNHLILFLLFFLLSCQAQEKRAAHLPAAPDKKVGGPCDGCDKVLEYLDQELTNTDTLPDFLQSLQAIKISGTIYQKDGQTPAQGILLYIYQTDKDGLYQSKSKLDGREYIYHHGCIKTDQSGHYAFYTFMPGAYPGRAEPKHIHPLIKEPGKSVYYIDDFVFESDSLLTEAKRQQMVNRGGSGILSLTETVGLVTGKRNIILGKNIPDYE